MPALPPMLAPLRERAFRRYFVGHTVSTAGNALTSVALVFAVLEVTGSAAAVGFVLAATRLPLTLFVLVGGVIGDRMPRHLVMLVADVVRFATQALAAVLLLTGNAALWHLLVLFGLHGLAQAFFNPAAAGLVPQLVTAGRLQRANALLDVSRNTTAVAGMLVGGALVAGFGAGIALAVDSLTFLVSAGALAALRLAGVVRVGKPSAFFRELRDGWDEFRSKTWLWVGVVHVALLNAFALVTFFVLGPVIASEALGGAVAWGTIGAGFAAGMVAGAVLAGRWRPSRPLVAAFAGILAAAPQLALLALHAPAPVVAAASVLGGAQASFWGVVWTTTLQERIPDDVLSRVAAYGSLGSLVLAPLGYAAVGPAAELLGFETVLWAGVAWIVASTLAVVSLPSIRGVERSPTERASRLAAAG